MYIYIYIENYLEINNDFIQKQIYYYTTFKFGMKYVASLLEFFIYLDKESQIIPIKIVLSYFNFIQNYIKLMVKKTKMKII